MRQITIAGALAAGSMLLGGCTHGEGRVGTPLADAPSASATLVTASGTPAGRAIATAVAGGLRVTIDAVDLPPGTHGAHVHAVGACDAPAFASVGPHWNPLGRKHGSMNPAGPHQGDLPNLIVGTDGRGTVGVVIPGATMADLLDADGAAIVVHAAPDDLATDPSGNSGGRIACGVLRAD